VDSVWATELATNLNPGNIGRIPTIFGDYFTEFESQSIDTELYGSVDITYPSGLTYNRIELDGNPNPATGDFAFNDGFIPPFYLTGIPTDVQFLNIGAPLDNEGQLTTNFTAAEPPITLDLYFWDDDEGSGTGFYTACGDDGDGIPELSDCHRDDLATPTPGSASTVMKLFILHIRVTLGWAATPGPVNFDMDYTTPPVIEITPATSTSHATIWATFPAADVINGTMPALTGTATYEECPHYHLGFTPAEFNSSDCGGFRAGTVDLVDFSVNELTLGIRFYPELPDWVFDNEWHDSVMLAYANDYRPDVNGTAGDCVTNPPCLQINGLGGINNDKVSILVIAGEHGWVDGDISPVVAADGSFANDVGDVFNLEDSDLDSIFDFRTVEDTTAPGDTLRDKILVIE
jgi:hypothetical protein